MRSRHLWQADVHFGGVLAGMALAALTVTAISAAAQSTNASPHCRPIGGTLMTNFIDQNTTLGTVTGDLAGAVSAVVIEPPTFPDDQTAVFRVQHRWVTESGDMVRLALAEAVARLTAPNVYGIVSYPVTITGGTGAFQHATGSITSIGAVDLNTGRTVFRYTGQLCLQAPAH